MQQLWNLAPDNRSKAQPQTADAIAAHQFVSARNISGFTRKETRITYMIRVSVVAKTIIVTTNWNLMTQKISRQIQRLQFSNWARY